MVSMSRLSLLCCRPPFCISPTRKVHPAFPSSWSSSTCSRRTTYWGLDGNVAGTQRQVKPKTEAVARTCRARVFGLNLRCCGSLPRSNRPSTTLQSGSCSSGPRRRSRACLGSGCRSPAWRNCLWSLNRTSWGAEAKLFVNDRIHRRNEVTELLILEKRLFSCQSRGH